MTLLEIIIIALIIFLVITFISGIYFAFITKHEIKELKNNIHNLEKFSINSNINIMLIKKEIEINKKNSILSDRINEKKIKNNQIELCNILILVRALYFRKITNLILDNIFRKYGTHFIEVVLFKDKQGKEFSIIQCQNPINSYESKKITSIIDYLLFIKEKSSEIIHLNFILRGIEIPKNNLIEFQQIEESKEQNNEEGNIYQRKFLNEFKVSPKVVVNYLLNRDSKDDIISKYLNLINPKEIIITNDIEDNINSIIDDIIQKEKQKSNEKPKEFEQELNINIFKEEQFNIFRNEEEKNQDNDNDLFINQINEDLVNEEIDGKNYNNYLEEIKLIVNEKPENRVVEREKILLDLKISLKRNKKLHKIDKITKVAKFKKKFLSSKYFYSRWIEEFDKYKGGYRSNTAFKREIDKNISMNEMEIILLSLINDAEFDLFSKDVRDFKKYMNAKN